MTGVVDLIERAGRVTTTEDALAIIAEWERHVVETGKSPEEARAIVESNLGYLRQYLTEAEADRFFALASGEEYTPRIDEVSQLKARVNELESVMGDIITVSEMVLSDCHVVGIEPIHAADLKDLIKKARATNQ